MSKRVASYSVNDICTALRKHLEETGGKQADIANVVGCSKASVSNWLVRGEIPRPQWLDGIARYLGWSTEEVMRAGGYLPRNGNGHGDPEASELDKARAATTAALSDLDLYELGVVAQLAHGLRLGRPRRQLTEGPSPVRTAILRPLSKRSRPQTPQPLAR